MAEKASWQNYAIVILVGLLLYVVLFKYFLVRSGLRLELGPKGKKLIEMIKGVFKGKPKYHCKRGNKTCNAFIRKCNESIIIRETEDSTEKMEIIRKGESCHISFLMKRSSISQLEGKRMTCKLPIEKSKFMLKPSSSKALKYCKGNLKDSYNKYLRQWIS